MRYVANRDLAEEALSEFDHVWLEPEDSFVGLALLARSRARRLVVFVHGWGGSAVETWTGFDRPPMGGWWAESDLIFVDYKSRRENVTTSADRLRREIAKYYPVPNADLLLSLDRKTAIRADPSEPYEELVIVAHSLGGLVVRRALVDDMDQWVHSGAIADNRPALLDATTRLFSPASAGFRPGAALWLVFMACPWLDDVLHVSRSYANLQPSSPVIASTKMRTEKYDTTLPQNAALAARIVWADPEDVVITEPYTTDGYWSTVDKACHPGKSVKHEIVCKPLECYVAPFEFVERGKLP